MHQEVITQIEAAWENRELLKDKNTQESIRKVIEWLDKGEVRVSESLADGKWKLNEWIKKAVLMYFPIQGMKKIEIDPSRCAAPCAIETLGRSGKRPRPVEPRRGRRTTHHRATNIP